jgi:hypothetical protein
MQVLSWNTLFRQHDIKYNPMSETLRLYPDDNERNNNILSLIVNNSDKDTFICLQECSKELVELLKNNFSESHNIFICNVIDYEDEYLITLSPKWFKCYQEDMSKYPKIPRGYIILEGETLRIVNCHLKPQRHCDFDTMYIIKNLDKKITIISGDFNEELKIVRKKLTNYTIPHYGKTYKKKQLDHIIINRNHVEITTSMIQVNYLSDHKMIKCVF